MVRDLRVRARELGDTEGLDREEKRREAWQWENALRRHNFVGFVGEVLKGVVRTKVQAGEGNYNEWIKEGVERTKKRVEEGRRRGGGEDDMGVGAA